MNQSLDALMGSICRALRDEILPELVSDHARSQLAGVLDVLGKIESMVVWSPDVTREQLELLEACIAEATARIASAGLAVPTNPCHPGLDPGSMVAGSDAASTSTWIAGQARNDNQGADTRNDYRGALTHAALQSALADAERRFALLTDWLFTPPVALPTGLSDELHELIRTTLRNTLKAQRRLVPSADFSSMTAPGQPAGAQGDST